MCLPRLSVAALPRALFQVFGAVHPHRAGRGSGRTCCQLLPRALIASCAGWLLAVWLGCGILAGAAPPVMNARPGSPEFALQADRLADPEAHAIRMAHGEAIVPCPLQAVEGTLGRSGLRVQSLSSQEGEGTLSLRLRALGRTSGLAVVPENGSVSVVAGVARLTRPGVVEECSTSAAGVRQDFVVLQAPTGAGVLSLELGVMGGTVAARGQAVSLTLPSGRKLVYHRLHVTDATGRVLPATMLAPTPTVIRIEVQDADAV